MSKLVVTNIETQNIKFDSDTTAFTIGSDGTTNFSADKREKIITGSAQAMSGTENTITGIPSNAHCVRLYIDGTYKNGTTQSLFQIGAGSIATSGYDWRVLSNSAGGSVYTEAGSSGCNTYADGASGSGYTLWGYFEVRKMISTTNRYLITCKLMSNNSSYHNDGIGYIDLGGTLDRVRWTTVAGSATFQCVSIFLEYSTT